MFCLLLSCRNNYDEHTTILFPLKELMVKLGKELTQSNTLIVTCC